MIKHMRPGRSSSMSLSIRAAAFETTRPTTHAAPTYVVDGVIHYCVTNMPGAVPRTSAFALNNATLPYVSALADKGWERATADDRGLAAGLNSCGRDRASCGREGALRAQPRSNSADVPIERVVLSTCGWPIRNESVS